jgi:hypothetical protein
VPPAYCSSCRELLQTSYQGFSACFDGTWGDLKATPAEE